MRPGLLSNLLLVPGCLLLVALALMTGCALTGSSDPGPSQRADNRQSIGDNDIEALRRSAQQQAQRSEQALARREQAQQNAPRPEGAAQATSDGPEVRWLNSGGVTGNGANQQRAMTRVTRPTPPPPQTKPKPKHEPEPEPEPVIQQGPARDAADVPVKRQTRKELLDQLMSDIARRDDPAMRRALTAAVLAMVDPDQPIAPEILTPLSPRQRRVVSRFRRVVIELSAQLEDDAELNMVRVARGIEPIMGMNPIKIRHAELCTRVSGFGNFDPFPDRTFLAGRNQRMIVYVELDHFKSVKPEDGDKHTVKLTQEVVLYNDADGLAVWRQEPVDIVDESTNRRRDFFVVQLIELPGRLNVGKYHLKIRVTDKQGGSLDETHIPIQFVADQKLVGR